MKEVRFARLGDYLKKKRCDAGLSQGDLAKALKYTSPQFVSNWERGLCAPAFNAMPMLTQLLGIPKREMIGLILEQTEAEMEKTFSDFSSKKRKIAR